MGDAELDYNVVFPEPHLAESHWHGQKEPVVILLGWAGCKDKHLAKYSYIYNEQGCITIRYTAPWKAVFFSEAFGSKKLLEIARKLLDLLYDYEVESHPILFHVFSNGGFMLYRYVIELLQREEQLRTLVVVGTILDSAPGNQNVIGSVRALNATLGPETRTVLRYPILAVFTCMVFLLRVVLYSLTKYIHKNHYDAMLDDPTSWPQLYLYSQADKVIAHRDVEQMVRARKQRGVRVESVDFINSDHVSHNRLFPEEYSVRCVTFLEYCLKSCAGIKRKHVSL
ncbi:transmembrane protein 53 [Polyodon spathula]|uniref:transmembrane protein 53 n=1 Tax=Polyodon spathula TaxID=7913 RepID=UPI001B7EBAF8|nr:transmembrane protein 53 [Polyodon spathula]